jgi:NAD(P)-dependent dehydrogenase (short-subunit alcohol dehydrogenase family)
MSDRQHQGEGLGNQPEPPYPQQTQEPPGSESAMRPEPDYGRDSYRGAGRLEGRAAIITGGDSGIGRAVAVAYAREGADVLISYLDEDADARATVEAVEASGRRCVAVAGDIGDETHCQALVRRAMDEFGRIDVLVNNAAYQMEREGILDLPSEEIERVFRTNIIAMFWMCKAAIPHMTEGGSIINTASVEAYQPKPSLLHYATTKGAIVTFTKGLAQELAPQGIRVNAVAPGPVWTPLIPMSMPPEHVEKFGTSTPIGRAAQPVELAPAYVYLASPEASFTVGTVIGVHGGMPHP